MTQLQNKIHNTIIAHIISKCDHLKEPRNNKMYEVNIATDYGLDGRGSLLHSVQIRSGAHSASYPMGTGSSFLGENADRASSCTLTHN
jgi:hypothetical protein